MVTEEEFDTTFKEFMEDLLREHSLFDYLNK